MMRATVGVLVTGLLVTGCGPNRTYPERAAFAPGAVTPLSCVPNLDGKIEGAEMPAALGVTVSYLVSPAGQSRQVDLVGKANATGQLVWDLSADYATDQVARLSASAVTGKWYAASFPTGQFTSPLDLAGSVDGVYLHDGSAIFLLGYASAQQNPPTGQTLVVYAQPIAVFRYPLEVSKEWVSISNVRDAMVRGLPYAGRDTYHVVVTAAGRLELPDLSFTQTMRVRTSLTIEPAIGPVIRRKQTSYVFECFGEVARATSVDNESSDDFTTTSELRRLGF